MSVLNQSDQPRTLYSDYPYLVYVRVSTDKDEQKDSVPNQIDICRYWIEMNNLEWNDGALLKDEGKSGTLFLERHALQLILRRARNRDIKMVVFKSIHRLARDLKDALEIKEVLVGHGVRVVTIEEGYDSYYEGKNDMKFEMYSMFAAQYPKTLSVSVSAVLASKVRKGHHVGAIPYGYDRLNHKLMINKDEAKVICQIFDWYNKDMFGFKTITRLLNEGLEDGVILPPKKKDRWQVTTVQRIIRNSTYCGTFIYNRYTKIKVDGRKKQMQNPQEKWLIFEDHHPAIISQEAWEKANNQASLNKTKKISPWNEFRGLLICGECQSSMITMISYKRRKSDGYRTTWRYMKCSAYRRAGKHGCVNHVPIQYEDFREFMLDKLLEQGKDMEFNLKNAIDERHKLAKKKLNRVIKNNQEKINDLIDLYTDKLIAKDEFKSKREGYDHHIARAKEKLCQVNKQETCQLHIKGLREAFQSLEDREQDLRHVFMTLIDHIVIHQGGRVDISYTFANTQPC